MSSLDLHTHCGYQSMLPEAVAVVVAPTDDRLRCGVFRLTTPEGLQCIQVAWGGD
jgi:STAM-binding protein